MNCAICKIVRKDLNTGLMLHKKKLNYENRLHIAKDIVEHRLPAKCVRWAQIIAKDYRKCGASHLAN